MKNLREVARTKRHKRIALKLRGSAARPRLIVKRSLNNLYAQFVDDSRHATLCAFSTFDKEFRAAHTTGGNIKSAQSFGELVARKAKEKGISKIVFDRAGYLYHGRVKVFADGLRKGGLEF